MEWQEFIVKTHGSCLKSIVYGKSQQEVAKSHFTVGSHPEQAVKVNKEGGS